MAQTTKNVCPVTKTEEEQQISQANDNGKAPADMWQEFLDSTTLHGIRYVFMKCHVLVRLLWLVILLISGGYYIFTVYRAFDKYYSRPINTILSHKHMKVMDFPAVTICTMSYFSRRKIFMTDDDPLFESSGLNISACAVTSGIRGDRPCGLSMLCCCTPYLKSDLVELPNCTTQYRQDLLTKIQKSGIVLPFEDLFRAFGHDVNAIVTPFCIFGRKLQGKECSAKDFVPIVTALLGLCFTFNSGIESKVRKVDSPGVSSGLIVILDAQADDDFGAYSKGFTVLVHGQGEYADENGKAINVGAGQSTFMALSQKRFENLEKPYATNCSKKTLKTFSNYTLEGCLYECENEHIAKICKCRVTGYKDFLGIRPCTTGEDYDCFLQTYASLDYEVCDCQVPCTETKYITEVSYSQFTESGLTKSLIPKGYDKDYQRNNFIFMRVGFKSLSYELQEQQPAYDSNSLFGEIGGNMGLFLGCSLLTICEFFDFVVRFLGARKRRITHAT